MKNRAHLPVGFWVNYRYPENPLFGWEIDKRDVPILVPMDFATFRDDLSCVLYERRETANLLWKDRSRAKKLGLALAKLSHDDRCD